MGVEHQACQEVSCAFSQSPLQVPLRHDAVTDLAIEHVVNFFFDGYTELQKHDSRVLLHDLQTELLE